MDGGLITSARKRTSVDTAADSSRKKGNCYAVKNLDTLAPPGRTEFPMHCSYAGGAEIKLAVVYRLNTSQCCQPKRALRSNECEQKNAFSMGPVLTVPGRCQVLYQRITAAGGVCLLETPELTDPAAAKCASRRMMSRKYVKATVDGG